MPCVSVSTLDALAENTTPLRGILVPCMDARRGQLYTAIFKSDGASAERITEDLAISIDELCDRLKKYGDCDIFLSGDGYEIARDGLLARGIRVMETPPLLITENAYSCAKVGLRKYNTGDYCTDSEICPTYLRLPHAERERFQREQQKRG